MVTVTTSDVMFLFPQKIKIAALRMYTCCVERINYDEFFDSEFTALGSLGRRHVCSHFASDMLIMFADIYPKSW